jgi:hypothetical protein
MSKPEKFVLCYRTKEDYVYKPITDKQGHLYAVPLGMGQAKVQDGGVCSGEMILLDLEPINEKLRGIRKNMKTDLDSCKMTAEQYGTTEEGKAYAHQFKLSAEYLEGYLKEIEEALPQLKDEPG